MRTITQLACCALAATFYTAVAHAEPAGAPPAPTTATSLAGAVAAAWERSVEFRASAGRRDVAGAGEVAASYLWAAPPSLDISRRDERGSSASGAKESEVGLTVPVLFPWQRSARQAAAASERDVADWSHAVARLRLAGEVRESAWDVAAKRAEADIADALVANLRSLADDVDKRIAAGELARADGLAARAEMYASAIVASDARQKLAAALARWRILTGLPPLADPSERSGTAGAGHPELALVAAVAVDARKRLELSRANRSEPPELTFRMRQDSPGAGLPAQNSIGFGLRIPFGTPDRNLPREAAARAEVDIARAAETRSREKQESDVRIAREALAAAEEQQAVEKARAELLGERAELVEKSFRVGETSLPDLLGAKLASAQARAGLARQQAAAGLAKARLNQSLGLLP